jgi:hypothetical protein
VVVLVDDGAEPLEFVAFPLAAGFRAERIGGEFDSLAAELVDVVVGAGDVLT